MLGLISRLGASQGYASAAASSAEIGPAATSLKMRREGVGWIDNKIHPNEKAKDQLESFRGVAYAATDKIGRRFAQIATTLWQCEYDAAENQMIETQQHFHPFITLFSTSNGHRPHEEYNVYEFKYITQVSLDLSGEAWWLVERDQLGVPSRLTPLPAHRVVIVFSKETGLISGYYYVPKGTTLEQGAIFIPKVDWKTLHDVPTMPFMVKFRYPSPHGIEDARGWSPIKAAAYAYDINLFEQIYKRTFLQQGAQLGGILQSDVALNKDQIEEYLDQFKNRHAGIHKAGLPMVLPKMLKWETTEPTPRDMQWAEAISLTASQILQIYGISDAKLGRADIGNRNTADAMDVTFNREVIQSRLDMFVAELNTGFVPVYPGQTDELYFSAHYDDPVPADGEMQLKREDQDIKNNIITPNDVRISRGVKKFGKFGDMVYKPLTHVAVDPQAETLELAQDDKDLLGFVSPEEQAKLDQATADAKAKTDGAIDGKAAKQGKDDATKK